MADMDTNIETERAAALPRPLIRVWQAGEGKHDAPIVQQWREKIAPEEEEDSLQPDGEGCQCLSEIHGYSRSPTLRSPWWQVWGMN